MTYFISPISVAQAATIINAVITFVHFTISLSLVVLLIHFMPKSNSALAWSSISRTLQSSVWPTILRTDSSSSRANGFVVSTISFTATITTGLVALAGVLLPLGLKEGPFVPANFREMQALYIPDSSSLALSTTPNRGNFVYGRLCGDRDTSCPGNDNPNSTTIAPSIIDIFNSTPHGPFTMQFRKFYDGDPRSNLSVGIVGAAQTFVLRNDTFVAEGLIVDMSPEHPGVGFWNQTIPDLPNGGTWSQDVLWLEPVTECVDTNVTLDYTMTEGPTTHIRDFNVTDHGGFINLTREPPPLNRDGQNIDLFQHAYKAAVYSDLFAMLWLNATREASHMGASYPVNSSELAYLSSSGDLGSLGEIPVSYLNTSGAAAAEISCMGYGGADNANVSNVHVNCAMFLSPPLRLDGGNTRIFDRGSRWTQGVFGCSSATRASIQTVTFSTNSTTNLQNLQITHTTSNLNALWATEKTNLNISDIDIFWGRVDDRYENDPSLWTVRSKSFYLPAGAASILDVLGDGNPGTTHAHMWGKIYGAGFDSLEGYPTDYKGLSDYSIKAKMQSLIAQNPTIGNAQIRNLVWTDMMANNIIGTQLDTTMMAANYLRTLEYDFRYAVPGFLLLLIWLPSFLGGLLLLLTRAITFERMRAVLNHTSVGRVVVGTSGLRVQGRGVGHMEMPQPGFTNSVNASFVDLNTGKGSGHRRNKSDWANTTGNVPVVLDLSDSRDQKYMGEEDYKLLPR
ncbi:hypothetical protein AN958_09987 [Leucoagaricus sp. SymC.cos]|nr:hypothetical protein AN958_09987 [Leucoagaricus sp. SymC.cos]